ncbi:MAG: hypothetical protein HS111_26815 [Kofleriaceae bacterium]|nr:hypothetical protein [Kofleriaceae bacterium]
MSWLLATVWASAVVAALSLVVLGVMFGPLERAFAARPAQRPWRTGSGVDLAFFLGQYLLWSALALVVLDAARRARRSGPGGVAGGRGGAPLAAQVGVAVVAGDLLVYGWHRACHAVPLLWRFHAVHPPRSASTGWRHTASTRSTA